MLNFCLYKPCAMCLSLLHFQPCAGSKPNCNCCLSNKYTYLQLRSPEITRVNFHLSNTHQKGESPVPFTSSDSKKCIHHLCLFNTCQQLLPLDSKISNFIILLSASL